MKRARDAAPGNVRRRRLDRARAGALAVIALAFALRVYRLADANVWWDEGWTVWLAGHDLGWIALRTASDEHPPLHYWLMHGWQLMFGTTAATGRFFSVLFGVLAVAVLYRLGKAIGGARLGLLAAGLLALARFQVWWSQDIKNYTLSAFFAWASVWFVWQWLFGKGRGRGAWVGYVACAALALYSHYLGALVVLASNLFVVIVLLARWRRGERSLGPWVRWALAQAAVFALFAPWGYVYLQNGATWTAAPAFDFLLFLRLAATVLALGVTTFIENYTWVVLALVGVAALAVGWVAQGRGVGAQGGREAAAWGAVYAWVILLVPPVLIYALSLTPAALFAPKIQARYLMMLAPAFALALALGILWMAQLGRGDARRFARVGALALAALVAGAQLFTLGEYYGARRLRDEYSTAMQVVNHFRLPGDALVLNTDQEWPTALYYLNEPMDWVGVPNGTAVDEAGAARVVAQLGAPHAVWVLTIPDALQKDPARLVERKLEQRWPKQFEQTFDDKRLTLYADAVRNVKDVSAATFAPQVTRDVALDGQLALVGQDLPVREVEPGDVVRVVTYWRAQDLATVNLRLETAGGNAVANASVPVSIGARERAEGDLQVPPGTSPQTLRVVAQARLATVMLGELQVVPRAVSTAAAVAPRTLANDRFGRSIRLVGLSVDRTELRAGEALPVTLFWQTDSPVGISYTVFVHLLGAQYNSARGNFLWGQVDRLPLAGQLPTTAWPPGETLDDAYAVPLDAGAPPGLYKVEVGLYEAATGERLRVTDANGQDLGDALIVGQVTVR